MSWCAQEDIAPAILIQQVWVGAQQSVFWGNTDIEFISKLELYSGDAIIESGACYGFILA